jgi:hypothetical protein
VYEQQHAAAYAHECLVHADQGVPLPPFVLLKRMRSDLTCGLENFGLPAAAAAAGGGGGGAGFEQGV